MAVRTLTIDNQLVSAGADQTILAAAREAGIRIPTLCHFEGLTSVGACRLCLVELGGETGRLVASCTTQVAEEMVIFTQSDRLREYRRMIVELLFSERNHVCSVCVANGHCELQDLAVETGMTHLEFDYLHPRLEVDISHTRYGIDHNRCVLCTRCVRVCDEVEGAHTWDVAGRGNQARVITDLDQPWGSAQTCTSCGKCAMACPTGAIFDQGSSVGEMRHHRETLVALLTAREKKQWLV